MAETEGENRHYGKIAAGWSVLTIASIRPLVRANASRTSNTHVLVFFIILVANVGGALTPLGNPTHFAGFLRGADFFWTIQNAWMQTGIVAALLLVMFPPRTSGVIGAELHGLCHCSGTRRQDAPFLRLRIVGGSCADAALCTAHPPSNFSNFEMELVDADTRIPRVDHCPLENNARDWSDARAVVSIREITHEQIPASLESMFDEIMERSAAGLTQAGDKPERQALPRPVAR